MRPYGIAVVADLDPREDSTTKRVELWREWYKSPIWKSIKRHRLVREPSCRLCAQEGQIVMATHVAHVRPYEGYESLFTSYENTQSLCARHYKERQRFSRNRMVRR
jgi:5-methylcytosine-specific restriction protein A